MLIIRGARALSVLPLLLLVLLVPPSGVAAFGETPGPKIDAFIRKAVDDYGVPGAAVAVVHGGSAVLLKGYGVRRVGEPAPVDENTAFQLASVSKTFTAAALASLADEGRLTLDDPVVAHLPEFALAEPYSTRYVTVRDLLTHRTGLPAFTGDLLGSEGYSRAEVLRRTRAIPPAHSFRDVPAYSNVGFFVAGEVAARTAGTSFEEVVRSRLLAPVGMARSGLSRAAVPADGNWAANHAVLDGRLQAVPWADSDVFAAAGGMVSTAADMARYVQMHLDGGRAGGPAGSTVLQPHTIETLFQPGASTPPGFTEQPPIGTSTGFFYSPGWGLYFYGGQRVLEKGGALSGVRTIVVLVPERRLGVVVLANRHLTLLPEAIRARVLETYLGPAALGDDLQATIRANQAAIDALFRPAPGPVSPGPPSLPPDGYVGVYENAVYGRVTVAVAGQGALRLAAGPAAYPGSLIHVSRDTFSLSWPEVAAGSQQVTFTVGPDGRADRVSTETLGEFERVADAPH